MLEDRHEAEGNSKVKVFRDEVGVILESCSVAESIEPRARKELILTVEAGDQARELPSDGIREDQKY